MDMSFDEVKAWLVENGFGIYAKEFYENDVDGVSLLHMTERMLELLVPKIGDRVKMMMRIEKLKAAAAAQVVPPSPASSTTASCEEMTVDPPTPTPPAPTSPNEKDQETNMTPGNKSNNRKRQAESPSDKPLVLNARRPWPAKVELPTSFRPALAEALQNKERLTPKLSSMLVAKLVEYFSQYTVYPVGEQITAICLALIEEYPFLADKSVGTGYDSWFSRIFEKFRYERKHMKEDPEVLLRKRKKGDDSPTIAASLRRGAINWAPPYPEGEDEASMTKHKAFLQNEWCRRNPDLEKVSNRMRLTFSDRRRLINNKALLVDIRSEYPSLFDYNQLVEEFERILNQTASILDTFKANLSQMADGILSFLEKKKKKSASVTELLSKLEGEEEESDEEATAEEKGTVILALLPHIFKNRNKKADEKDFMDIIPEGTDIKTVLDRHQLPAIVITGQLENVQEVHIVGENQVICTVPVGEGLHYQQSETKWPPR